MSKKEIIAYAITHAPPGVKGGPYEGSGAYGFPAGSLRTACRWYNGARPAEYTMQAVRVVVPTARVIRIVRKARPSEAPAMLETARRRLAAVAEHMTEHAYQELASALEVDACRVGPSEASAVDVLRSFIAWVDCDDGEEETPLRPIEDAARAVLAASGPDPSEVVRAAMAEECARVRMTRAEHGIGDFAALETVWLRRVEATRVAVKKYRKAGGK